MITMATVWDDTNDGDCDGVPALEDCDDSNPDIYYQVERKNMLYYVSPEWNFTKCFNNQNILLYEQFTASSSFNTYLFTEYNFDSTSNPIGKTIYTMTYNGEESTILLMNQIIWFYSRVKDTIIPSSQKQKRTITYKYSNNIHPVTLKSLQTIINTNLCKHVKQYNGKNIFH